MKKTFALLIALIMMFSLSFAAFAGNGDGSGGGNGQPLMLAGSSVSNGSKNVPTDVYITLTFSKNVVNFTVKNNNMGCFSMRDSKGGSVPISVVMGDDQVDPDCKRIIGIQTSDLAEGETYTLVISGNLQSKSGVSLGSDISISFTTVAAAVQETEKPVQTAKPVQESEKPEDSTETEAPETTEEPEMVEVDVIEKGAELLISGAPDTAADGAMEVEIDYTVLYIILGASAAVLAAVYFVSEQKHK